MGKDEKEMWDWLCGDMEIWSEYTKKEEKNETRRLDNRPIGNNRKFTDVNSRLFDFLNRYRNKCD